MIWDDRILFKGEKILCRATPNNGSKRGKSDSATLPRYRNLTQHMYIELFTIMKSCCSWLAAASICIRVGINKPQKGICISRGRSKENYSLEGSEYEGI